VRGGLLGSWCPILFDRESSDRMPELRAGGSQVSNDRENQVSTRLVVAKFLLAAAAALSSAVGAEGGQSWQPPPPRPDDFDWVQLKSGEWLKGELVAMYDEELGFDLFGDLDFDVSWVWDRIQDPRPGSDGVLPQQDDFRTIFGLSYSF